MCNYYIAMWNICFLRCIIGLVTTQKAVFKHCEHSFPPIAIIFPPFSILFAVFIYKQQRCFFININYFSVTYTANRATSKNYQNFSHFTALLSIYNLVYHPKEKTSIIKQVKLWKIRLLHTL